MHPCEQGYDCKYPRKDRGHGICVEPHCHMVRDGDTVTDTLTGEVTEWTTMDVKKEREHDPVDVKYEQFLSRFGLKSLMEDANTYERRHGVIKQKRHVRG